MASDTGAGTERHRPSPPRAGYALLVLTLATLATSLGRGVLALLVEPIEADLRLSDAEIALLFGFAFVVFYALVALPVARLVDGGNRRTILGTGLALWSAMTALAAITGGFWSLMLARIGAGAGEAAVGPASFSMLANLNPRERLSRAIAVTSMGTLAGNGLALIAGGAIVAALLWLPTPHLPVIGELRSWQIVLILSGLPAFSVAVLALTVREPARPDAAVPSSDEVARHLVASGKAYGPIIAAITLMAMLSYGHSAWAPAFLMRSFGWTPAEAGLVLGNIILVGGSLGALAGGFIAGRLAARGRADAEMRVVWWSALIAVPAAILFPQMPSAGLSVALGALFCFAVSLALGPQVAAIQLLTPSRMRARVTALCLFAFNVLGIGLGPFAAPLIAAEGQIGFGMSISAAIIGPLAILAAWLSLRPYAEQVKAAA